MHVFACGACRLDTQIQLPAGLSAKDLLKTAPYNAQNPQTNQVRALAPDLNPCAGANALCMRAFVLCMSVVPATCGHAFKPDHAR